MVEHLLGVGQGLDARERIGCIWGRWKALLSSAARLEDHLQSSRNRVMELRAWDEHTSLEALLR